MISHEYFALFIRFHFAGTQAIVQQLQSLDIDNKINFVFLLPKGSSRNAYGYMQVRSLSVFDKLEKQLGAIRIPIQEYAQVYKLRCSDQFEEFPSIEEVTNAE